MPNENISLNGTGKFQQNTENAGVVTYGEFSQTSVNTGSIAVSALFTGFSVNSGSIGGSLPYKTALLVQTNSAHWDAAFDAMGDFVLLNDPKLTDAREPLAHTQAISTINGLEDALIAIQTQGPQGGALDLDHTNISDFDQAVTDIASPLISAAVTGVDVTASISTAIGALDVAGTASGVVAAAAGVSVASLVNGLVPSAQLPSYVDDVLEFSALASFPVTGETGKIYVDTTAKKIYRWSGSAYIEISPSPGSTDSVTEGANNLYYTNTRASAAAPVQSVAGKTGAVTLDASDISGLSAAVIAYAPTAPSQLVQSVAGKTGTVNLVASDITGLQTALDSKQVSGSYVTTTISNALSSAIDGKQAAGSYASDSHVHVISGVTGLQTALDSKQASGSYASSVHTHSTSDITGFNDAADARIAAAVGNTVASLVNGTVPSAQLPSYVDDVLEYSALASFPVTGESGKIYVDTTVKKIYRWSGSAYVEISPSPGSTDSVTEGTTNLYYTNARASAAAPVQSVAGKTGAVTLSSSDITGLSAAVVTYAPSQLVSSVAGRTGVITLSASDIRNLSLTVLPLSGGTLTGSVIGTTATFSTSISSAALSGIHYGDGSRLTGIAGGVTSVAGKTGVVTLSTSDITGLTTLIGNKTVSTSTPIGGNDGDFWYQY